MAGNIDLTDDGGDKVVKDVDLGGDGDDEVVDDVYLTRWSMRI
jgi:hypothetical protein